MVDETESRVVDLRSPAAAQQREDLKTEYVAWLLDPDRSPTLQKDWARAHGLHEVTVSRWRHDDFVLALLKRSNEMLEPAWALAMANLIRIAHAQFDDMTAVQAIKELGKLLKKYPDTKVDVAHHIERIAYVTPGALRELSASLDAKEEADALPAAASEPEASE